MSPRPVADAAGIRMSRRRGWEILPGRPAWDWSRETSSKRKPTLAASAAKGGTVFRSVMRPGFRTDNVENPFFLAVSRNGRFLYSIDAAQFGGEDEELVAAYAIEGRTGKLKKLNRQSARGAASCYLDVDATGQTVLVANYSTGSVAALPVQEDGLLGEAASVIEQRGSSVHPKRQNGPCAHSIVVSSDNRFVFAP